jgi:ribosomal protein L17
MAGFVDISGDEQRRIDQQLQNSNKAFLGAVDSYAEGQKTKRQRAIEAEEIKQKLITSAKRNLTSEENQAVNKLVQGEEVGDGFSYLYGSISRREAEKDSFDRREKQAEREDRKTDRELKRQQLGIDKTKPSDAQLVGAGFARRAELAENDLKKLGSQVGTGKFDNVSYVPEALKSKERKLFEQSKNNFVSAVLRKESGAVISPEEREAEEKKYFAQPGDPPEVLAQKEVSRRQAIENLKSGSGAAYERVVAVGPASVTQIPKGAILQNFATTGKSGLTPEQRQARRQELLNKKSKIGMK